MILVVEIKERKKAKDAIEETEARIAREKRLKCYWLSAITIMYPGEDTLGARQVVMDDDAKNGIPMSSCM